MNEHSDKEIDEYVEEIDNDFGEIWKDEHFPQRNTLLDFILQKKTLIIGGVCLLISIILIAVFFGSADNPSKANLKPIYSRLKKLENRIQSLEVITNKIVLFEKQEKELQKSIAKADESSRSLKLQIDELTRKFSLLENKMLPAITDIKKPQPIKTKPISPVESHYHQVRQGDTLYSIARQYDTSVDELSRLNHLTRELAIYPGQKLLVHPGNSR
ncbi:MAG: LysM peptidoglycan-binding domain-containing protein [Thermodesulfobacteriota bacterium]|nr:LysM peptidoglycan-binding domain-containing protein [Thermodesulfobacteriota bacterium]